MVKKLRRKFIQVAMISVVAVLVILIGAINIINYNSVTKTATQKIQILADNGGKFPESSMMGKHSEDGASGQSSSDSTTAGTASGDTDSTGDTTSEGNSTTPPAIPENDTRMSRSEMRTSAEMPFDTRYFTVQFDSTGAVTATNVDNIAALTEEEASAVASTVYEKGHEEGYYEDYRYIRIAVDASTEDATTSSDTAAETTVASADTAVETGSTSSGDVLYIFVDCTRERENFRQFLYASVGVSLVGFVAVFLLVYFLSRMVTRPVQESYLKQKRFVTDASHEIKTPLAIIQANTEVLELTSDEDNKWIKSIQNQVDRLSKLTEKLVFISRMDEENEELIQKVDIDLSEIVQETAEGYQSMADSNGKELHISVEHNIHVVADESMMRQVVSLLLDNAMKYSDEHGEIDVTLTKEGRTPQLVVTNTVAPGSVAEGDHPEFFDRFYRADKSRKSKAGSFGIGLSVVEAIVEAHKGHVSANCHSDEVAFKVRL